MNDSEGSIENIAFNMDRIKIKLKYAERNKASKFKR